MFNLKEGQLPIFIVHTIALIIFTIIYVFRRNFEFLGYIAVILVVMGVILYTNKMINYPNPLLWGLTAWSIMHMGGGSIFIAGTKLYDLILIPLIGEPYNIFRYDQLAHAVGFGVTTMLMFYLLKPNLIKGHSWKSLMFVIVMAGTGAGALNEVIEFSTTLIVEETGVGGYINNSIDLVFNLFGAIIAAIFIRHHEK